MSDDIRQQYDRTAAEWRTACDAIGTAGGQQVAIPVTQLSILLFGYEQLKKERETALNRVDGWERSGLGVDDYFGILDIRHALGAISDEVWQDHVAAASKVRPEDCAPSEVPE